MDKTINKNVEAKDLGFAFFFVIFLMIVISFLGELLFRLFKLNEIASQIISCTFSFFAITISSLYFKKKKQSNLLFVEYVKKFDFIYIIPALLLCFGMLFGLGFINVLFSEFLQKNGVNVTPISVNANNGLLFFVYLFVLGVFPAFSEELFFRGFITNNLRKKDDVFAILISGLLFSLYHCSLAQLIYQFIYGVFLAILFIKSKSVIPGIIAHFLNNFIILLSDFLVFNIDLNNVILIILGILSLMGFVLFICLYNRKEKTRENSSFNAKEFFVPYGMFGIIVCFLLIISEIFVV
ncbi:MAG: CPBP family intramembrane metalloprotease [Clostridia bacterium]|nr:CPBP family intramembrane metalloprotease [Clostridia bacterium]